MKKAAFRINFDQVLSDAKNDNIDAGIDYNVILKFGFDNLDISTKHQIMDKAKNSPKAQLLIRIAQLYRAR